MQFRRIPVLSVLLPSWRSWFIYLALILLIIAFSLLDSKFLTLGSFRVIGQQTAMVALMAFGMTFVITAAQIDLSVGSIMGLVGVMAAFGLQWGLGIAGASLLGIATGTCIGFVNGVVTAKLRIPAFLVTLGMLGAVRGLALMITGTRTVVMYNDLFPRVWGAPISILWVAVFFVTCILMYNHTAFGNYVKATGGNMTAARFSGINTDRVVIQVMMLSGFLSSIAGLLMAARFAGGRPEVGAGLELDAIAAVILGGTSLFGGRGSIVRTLIGALIMGVISHGLVVALSKFLSGSVGSGIESGIEMMVKGVIIVAAVSLSEKSQ